MSLQTSLGTWTTAAIINWKSAAVRVQVPEKLVCKVRTQESANLDEEVKLLVSAWWNNLYSSSIKFAVDSCNESVINGKG